MVLDDDQLIREYDHLRRYLQIRRHQYEIHRASFFNEVLSQMPEYGQYLLAKEGIDMYFGSLRDAKKKGKLGNYVDRLKLFFFGCAMTKEARAVRELMKVNKELRRLKKATQAHPEQLTENQRRLLEIEPQLRTTKESLEQLGVFEANYLRALRERGIGPHAPELPAVDDEHLSWTDDEVEMLHA